MLARDYNEPIGGKAETSLVEGKMSDNFPHGGGVFLSCPPKTSIRYHWRYQEGQQEDQWRWYQYWLQESKEAFVQDGGHRHQQDRSGDGRRLDQDGGTCSNENGNVSVDVGGLVLRTWNPSLSWIPTDLHCNCLHPHAFNLLGCLLPLLQRQLWTPKTEAAKSNNNMIQYASSKCQVNFHNYLLLTHVWNVVDRSGDRLTRTI